MKWLILILCVAKCVDASPCRQAGSTLFCSGEWDGESRRGVDRLIVREWNRQWCGDGSIKTSVFGRGASCRSFTKQCGYTPSEINGESCADMLTPEDERQTASTDRQHERTGSTPIYTGQTTKTVSNVTEFSLTEEPGMSWAYVGLGTLGGLCLLLIVVLIVVLRTKKLFLFKPKTSPTPTPRRENVLLTPLPSRSNSFQSLELFP